MGEIADRLERLRVQVRDYALTADRAPDSVSILAVSKTRSNAEIEEAMGAGQREFGENRVQELSRKAGELAGRSLGWHLIGSLQTNKVKDVIGLPGLELIHSLDRVRLAEALQKALDHEDRKVDCLLQVDATGEADKHGARPEEVLSLAERVIADCPNLALQGVMAMGPLESDPAPVFAQVGRVLEDLREKTGLPLPVLSLGMSGDIPQAIAAGSTLVRVGTAIFGPRRPR
ncbi:MAG: YggS family pyridoxal phosphate-dependent enzyme [Planctomycetota bacterium]|jgi:pyridoxal phosphate enzyme (YggS family)